MTYETIVTLFDSAQHAAVVRHNLEREGFSTSEISSIGNQDLDVFGGRLRDCNLWQRLIGAEVQPHEAGVFANVIEGGGILLTLRVPDERDLQATKILASHNPVDIYKRAVADGLRSAGFEPQTAIVLQPSIMVPDSATSKRGPTETSDESSRGSRGRRHCFLRFAAEGPVTPETSLHEEQAAIIRSLAAERSIPRNADWPEKTMDLEECPEGDLPAEAASGADDAFAGQSSIVVRALRNTVRERQMATKRVPAEVPANHGR